MTASGFATGRSRRFEGTIVRGWSAWTYRPDVGHRRVGLTDAEHTRLNGSRISEFAAVNNAGQVVGTSNRYSRAPDTQVGVSAFFDSPRTGSVRIGLFDAEGAELRRFAGHRNTLDIALNASSETVVLIGWRQATANDGMRNEPVQIAYLRGVGTDGVTRWTDYDWSTEVGSPNFINRPENNMADTRGYRVSFGRDGRLLAAFECAGGNHIFRYLPTDIATRSAIVGGDTFHTFSNTRSEHKPSSGSTTQEAASTSQANSSSDA